MRYNVRAGDRCYELEVRERDGQLELLWEGQVLPVSFDVERRGIRCVRLGDRYLRFGWRRTRDGYEITLAGQVYLFRVHDARLERLLEVGGSAPTQDGRTEVRAPIPGLVCSVRVKPGDRVQKGDGLIILSAMKLENDIPAPRDGVVQSVPAAEGAAVSEGEVLIVLE